MLTDRMRWVNLALSHLADRPFHLLRPICESGQDDLLAASGLMAPEIDAFLQAHPRPVRSQPPAAARAEPQKHGLAILLQARVHIGMQMKPQRERLRVRSLD